MIVTNCKKGFTLIEVLVSMVVLSVSIVILMQLLSASIKTIPDNKQYTKAVGLARLKMEEVLTLQNLSLGHSSGTFDKYFSWTLDVSNYEDPDDKDHEDSKDSDDKKKQDKKLKTPLLKIDLTVNWNQEEKEKSYTLSTLKAMIEQ